MDQQNIIYIKLYIKIIYIKIIYIYIYIGSDFGLALIIITKLLLLIPVISLQLNILIRQMIVWIIFNISF